MVEDKVRANLGLAHELLKKFGLVGNPDAISLAYEALYNAIVTYDPSKGSKLSTYAYVCIYNRLGSLVRSMNTLINTNVISYDTPINDDGSTLLDTLHSDETADGELLSQCGVSVIERALVECQAMLTNPVHRKIVDAWVESDFKMTHVEIATAVGCTQSYVSQIIKKFKYMLRRQLENE